MSDTLNAACLSKARSCQSDAALVDMVREQIEPSPIDDYLRGQQQLSAVERFADTHEAGGMPDSTQRYKALLPATPPGQGQQYAFEVDLDLCSGCKSCVTACHSLNGLDDAETWRDVGLLHGGTDDAPVLQHVTSSCHHCLDPPCVTACPVDAYEKDPVTGIVKHLDDQCFGCQYCTLACPYEAPKYHHGKGIVRKCDMCADRLTAGEAPACVQACPHEAIRITLVDKERVIAESETSQFVPGAHDPQYTLPTTTYKTNTPLPRNLLPADYYSVQPEHAHWPLVIMLVLTQLACGAFLVDYVFTRLAGYQMIEAVGPAHSFVAVLFGALALGASTFHLGRPAYAFRAVIGLRHSWLSREIVAFGLFFPLTVASVITAGQSTRMPETQDVLPAVLEVAVVVTGLLGIVCSVMIYQCTRRVFWSGPRTAFRFVSTTLIMGLATVLLTSVIAAVWSARLSMAQMMSDFGIDLCKCLVVIAAGKLAIECADFRHLRDRRNTPLKRSAMLMVGELANPTLARFGCGLLGGIWLPGTLIITDWQKAAAEPSSVLPMLIATAVFVACLAGETLERYLFFTAVVRAKMPGRLSP